MIIDLTLDDDMDTTTTAAAADAASAADAAVTTIINNAEAFEEYSNLRLVSEENESLIRNLLRTSFSPKFNNNAHMTSIIVGSFALMEIFMDTHARDEISMISVLKAISVSPEYRLAELDTRSELRLAFEAVIVFAYMKSRHAHNVKLTRKKFEEKYPQFCGTNLYLEEQDLLFDFCNYVRYVNCLLPIKDDIHHVLDLVFSVTDGYGKRCVSFCSLRRYDIIEREGKGRRNMRRERRKPLKILG